MREIKFRAWSTMGEPKMIQLVDGKIGGRLNDLQEEDDWKVMQYTGLKDKNGVEIYEGDLVRMFDRSIWEVIWDDYYAQFMLQWQGGVKEVKNLFGLDQLQFSEFIGNIYENPELLTPTDQKEEV